MRQRRISCRENDISFTLPIFVRVQIRSVLSVAENVLLDLSYEFAVAIVSLTDKIDTPKSSYMSNQLARAGPSVGANIHEAQYAQSRKDFVSKLEIALKETSETSYWLKHKYDTGRISQQTYTQTEAMCGKIRRLLIASCRTAKENAK